MKVRVLIGGFLLGAVLLITGTAGVYVSENGGSLRAQLGGTTVEWTGGAENGQWGDARNWSANHVPNENDDVFIKIGTPIPIAVESQTTKVKNLTIDHQDAVLSITPQLGRLTVRGTFQFDRGKFLGGSEATFLGVGTLHITQTAAPNSFTAPGGSPGGPGSVLEIKNTFVISSPSNAFVHNNGTVNFPDCNTMKISGDLSSTAPLTFYDLTVFSPIGTNCDLAIGPRKLLVSHKLSLGHARQEPNDFLHVHSNNPGTQVEIDAPANDGIGASYSFLDVKDIKASGGSLTCNIVLSGECSCKNSGNNTNWIFCPGCGNGIKEGTEQCDGEICCGNDCKFKVSGTECRASADACDVAEKCSGSAATCPNDADAADGTVCSPPSGGTCQGGTCIGGGQAVCGNGQKEGAEQCDGEICCGNDCKFKGSGTECRASADACDVAEKCSGSAATCPNDAKETSGTECRAAAGVCDRAETCDGSSNACPSDAFKTVTEVCRAAAGACNPAEKCTGTATCPADVNTCSSASSAGSAVSSSAASVSSQQSSGVSVASSPASVSSKKSSSSVSSGGICGNGGSPEPPEECDDGNTADNDGCSSTCKKEKERKLWCCNLSSKKVYAISLWGPFNIVKFLLNKPFCETGEIRFLRPLTQGEAEDKCQVQGGGGGSPGGSIGGPGGNGVGGGPGGGGAPGCSTMGESNRQVFLVRRFVAQLFPMLIAEADPECFHCCGGNTCYEVAGPRQNAQGTCTGNGDRFGGQGLCPHPLGNECSRLSQCGDRIVNNGEQCDGSSDPCPGRGITTMECTADCRCVQVVARDCGNSLVEATGRDNIPNTADDEECELDLPDQCDPPPRAGATTCGNNCKCVNRNWYWVYMGNRSNPQPRCYRDPIFAPDGRYISAPYWPPPPQLPPLPSAYSHSFTERIYGTPAGGYPPDPNNSTRPNCPPLLLYGNPHASQKQSLAPGNACQLALGTLDRNRRPQPMLVGYQGAVMGKTQQQLWQEMDHWLAVHCPTSNPYTPVYAAAIDWGRVDGGNNGQQGGGQQAGQQGGGIGGQMGGPAGGGGGQGNWFAVRGIVDGHVVVQCSTPAQCGGGLCCKDASTGPPWRCNAWAPWPNQQCANAQQLWCVVGGQHQTEAACRAANNGGGGGQPGGGVGGQGGQGGGWLGGLGGLFGGLFGGGGGGNNNAGGGGGNNVGGGGSVCGNNTIEGTEECDGTELNGQTCESLHYAGGTLSCTPQCQFDTGECVLSAPPVCGNRRKEGAEQCDGENCCGDDCKFQSDTTICRVGTNCRQDAKCSGNSVGCPSNIKKEDGTDCSPPSGGKCESGTCWRSDGGGNWFALMLRIHDAARVTNQMECTTYCTDPQCCYDIILTPYRQCFGNERIPRPWPHCQNEQQLGCVRGGGYASKEECCRSRPAANCSAPHPQAAQQPGAFMQAVAPVVNIVQTIGQGIVNFFRGLFR